MKQRKKMPGMAYYKSNGNFGAENLHCIAMYKLGFEMLSNKLDGHFKILKIKYCRGDA